MICLQSALARLVTLPWRGWMVPGIVWALVQGALGAPVDFNRDVRPILSEHCYTCHGPDERKRKAGLRLDIQEDAFRKLKSGHHALVAGDPARSTLLARIKTADPDEIMPPPKDGKPLSPAQVATLERWVNEGAAWKGHWSFTAPVRPELPAVKDGAWPRNPVDDFILSKLEREGLQPSPEADKATLIRRATLDLTGLPPSVEEVDRFLGDTSPDAYERLVDRLLQNAHYGERMAANWLDLARYADTSGYHFDGVRFMWLWRDWVIQSFNQNQPYDQFTVEQLAGDLLPNPTREQRIATGFCRNNMTNDEGGADPDEYLNKYVVDRVNTLGAVHLGMTLGCAECHDHKYDPLTMRDFYRLYAYFHNVPEKGLDRIRSDNPPPRLPVPSTDQALQFVEAEFRVRDAEKTLKDRTAELGETEEKWARETQAKNPPAPDERGHVATLAFDDSFEVSRPAPAANSARAAGAAPNANDGPRLALTAGRVFVPGRLNKALQLDGRFHVDAGPLVAWSHTNAFTCAMWLQFTGDGAAVSKMAAGPGYRGWDLMVADRRFQVHLIHQWPDNAIKVRTRESFEPGRWHHVAVTCDGSGKAAGVRLYVNGRPADVDVEKDALSGTIANQEPVRVGARHGEAGFPGILDDLRLYDRAMPGGDVRLLAFQGMLPIVLKSGGKRSPEEREDMRRFYRENYATDYLRSEEALAKARQAREGLFNAIPTTMVMEDMEKPRDTFILLRGDFRNKGERVAAGTPAFLPPPPPGLPANRLGLARWLVAPNHPLMARVTVNRYWALLFGTGLVKTMNDFGSQGEWPSHPELLDWLACQFRDGGTLNLPSSQGGGLLRRSVPPWNVKEFMRLLVTSAAYRQAATVTAEKLERDPYNRWVSRGPRLRLDAEFLRDNALAVAGLLNTRIGGPSVKPYQPPGIWDGTDAEYVQDKGPDLYRRGMYVFWRRSAHYPSFATFDAPNREVCTFLRQRTQTPLQSLVLMNDPVYVESARGLAQRVTREEPADIQRRLARAFRHALGRPPQAAEMELLRATYERQLAEFRAHPANAGKLLKVGESAIPEGMDQVELAALTGVANVILNLNETITK